MLYVVVAENLLRRPRVPHPLDHRGVVESVRQDDAARQHGAQRRQRRLVRDVARSEEQGRFLAVEVGEFALEQNVVVGGAGDVAGAAGARPGAARRLAHRLDHARVLAHAEIVVRAPDGDLAFALPVAPDRAGETPGAPRQIGEDPVSALRLHLLQRPGEMRFVVHGGAFPMPRGRPLSDCAGAATDAGAGAHGAFPSGL